MIPCTFDIYDGRELDAVVIGAGPAGATYASFLAAQGLQVVVVEGKRFPREHIGESLLSVSMPILSELGLMPALERKKYPRKHGAVFIWGEQRATMELDMPAPGFAFQVSRSEFDEMLLHHAVEAGAAVWQEHWVKKPIWRQGRMCGVEVAPAGGGETREVYARIVVDASGLFQFLPRKMGLEMDTYGPQRAAITWYVEGAGRYEQPYRDDIISEASRDGWLWFIPLSDQLTSVGFVGDETDLTGSPAAFLAAQIESAPLVRSLLSDSSEVRKPRLLRYTNHEVRSPLWTDGYLLIGDTAIFVDPLFSTGVHGALFSAWTAAAATVSWLRGGLREDVVAAWYDARFRTHYARVQAAIHLLYGLHSGPSRFWKSRDCTAISGEDARDLVRRVGASGMDFFKRNHLSGALPLPAEISTLLESIHTRIRPVRIPSTTVVEMSPGVELRSDFGVVGGRLAPTMVLAHCDAATQELEFACDSPTHQILQRVDGKRSVAELASAGAGGEAIPVGRAELLLGALVDGGFVRPVEASVDRAFVRSGNG